MVSIHVVYLLGLHSRRTLLHVRKRELGDSEHLQDIAAECAFDVVQVNLGEVGTLHLLRGIVDKDVDSSVP